MRLHFNSARAWFQHCYTHKGRNVIRAVAGNIPSTARSPGAWRVENKHVLT